MGASFSALIAYLGGTGGAAAGGAAAATGTAAATTTAAAGAAAGGITAGQALTASLIATGVGALGSKLLQPKMPSLAGNAPPTIDQAKQAQQQADRLKARRGVLANIYGGALGGGAPSVGVKTLLGQ